MEATQRLSLPMLVPGQAQKEIFHNEALLVLDMLVAASVQEFGRDEPPQSPEAGACFIVSATPGGDWSQYPDHLACFTSAGWRYVPPVIGMAVALSPDGRTAYYGASGWEVGSIRASRLLIDDVQVVGAQAPAIQSPSGGSSIDTEARAALDQVLETLRSHGLIARD